MIGFYDYTVLATYAATALGVTGMFQAVEGRHLTAVFCLLAAGLLDCFDGRIARTKRTAAISSSPSASRLTHSTTCCASERCRRWRATAPGAGGAMPQLRYGMGRRCACSPWRD